MSIQLMSKVWLTSLPTTEKMVLLVIADHASDDGTESWPSQATIAKKSSISVRSVQRAVNSLVVSGYLKMEKHKGGSADCREDRRPHRYTIHISRLRGDKVTTREEERGDICDGDGATFATATGRHLRPMNHPLEPSLELSQFLAIYPRKDGGTVANQKALGKALKVATLNEIITGANRYAHDPNRSPAYTKMPATWLNKGCWNDPLLPSQPLSPAEARKMPTQVPPRLQPADLPSGGVPMPDHVRELARMK